MASGSPMAPGRTRCRLLFTFLLARFASSSRSSSGSRRSWLSAASISRSLRGDPDDSFRRSATSRDGGDDEENLRWAREKLPTYDRMRRGIIRRAMLVEEGGGATKLLAADEVDLANLDPGEGRELMERMFKAVEDDNEHLLR